MASVGAAAVLLHGVSASAAGGDERVVRAAPHSEQTKRERRELVFVDAELGLSYVDMLALKDGELLDPTRAKSSGFGLTYGAGLGVRLHDFTLAVRYRRGNFSDWQLWTLGGEADVSFTLGRISPHFGFGAGYASLSGLVADISRAFTASPAPEVDISGLNVRVNVGADYYVSSWFSVGANLSCDAFFLRRRGDHLIRTSSTDPNSPPPFLYGIDGSGNGLGATLSLVLGLHY